MHRHGAAMSASGAVIVAVCNQCGLANRLKLMANAHALAAWCRARLEVVWESAPGCAAPAGALFAGGRQSNERGGGFEPGLAFVDLAEVRARPGLWAPGQRHPDGIYEDIARVAGEPGRTLVIDAPGASDFALPGVSAALLAQHKSAFYAGLPVHEQVLQRVADARARWPVAPGQPVVGVHVRTFVARHDTADGLDFEAYSRPEDFLAVLAAFDARHALAVCTNDREALGWLWAQYPHNRAFSACAGESENSRDEVAGVREAFVEWLLLGSCDAVVGTYYSSFSDEAALYGRPVARYCPLSSAGLEHAGKQKYHARGFEMAMEESGRFGVLHARGVGSVLGRMRRA